MAYSEYGTVYVALTTSFQRPHTLPPWRREKAIAIFRAQLCWKMGLSYFKRILLCGSKRIGWMAQLNTSAWTNISVNDAAWYYTCLLFQAITACKPREKLVSLKQRISLKTRSGSFLMVPYDILNEQWRVSSGGIPSPPPPSKHQELGRL